MEFIGFVFTVVTSYWRNGMGRGGGGEEIWREGSKNYNMAAPQTLTVHRTGRTFSILTHRFTNSALRFGLKVA